MMSDKPEAPDERKSGKAAGLGGALRAGAFWGIGGRLAAILALVATNGAASRLLAPSSLGTYFLAMSLVTLGASIGTFGLDRLAVRRVAEASARGDRTGAAQAARRHVALSAAVTAIVTA